MCGHWDWITDDILNVSPPSPPLPPFLISFHFLLELQLGQKFSQPPADDMYYSQARSMLTSLGLQNYEKNFKKGLLTDSTLPLLTDRQVDIPAVFTLLFHEIIVLLSNLFVCVPVLLEMSISLLDLGFSSLITFKGSVPNVCWTSNFLLFI